MGDLLTTLRENWEVIARAPLAFAIWTAALAALCWAVLSHLKSNQIGDLESRLNLRDDEIAEYKRKLDGASPDEAKARIDALEQRVEDGFKALAPRDLSKEQKQKMIAALDRQRGHHVTVVQEAGVSDARLLSRKIADVFLAARWTTSTLTMLGFDDPPPGGIALMVMNPDSLNAPQIAIHEAFRAAGIEIDVKQGLEGIDEPDKPQSVAQIIITSPEV
jgi:hypothetical protein